MELQERFSVVLLMRIGAVPAADAGDADADAASASTSAIEEGSPLLPSSSTGRGGVWEGAETGDRARRREETGLLRHQKEAGR